MASLDELEPLVEVVESLPPNGSSAVKAGGCEDLQDRLLDLLLSLPGADRAEVGERYPKVARMLQELERKAG